MNAKSRLERAARMAVDFAATSKALREMKALREELDPDSQAYTTLKKLEEEMARELEKILGKEKTDQ